MSNQYRWLPGRRDEQLAMAQSWCVVLPDKWEEWGIPEVLVTELTAMTGTAADILAEAKSAMRNQIITAQCKMAFDGLIEKMRFIKERYFHAPPLTLADFEALGLKMPDTTHTPKPAPSTAPVFRITQAPGRTLLIDYQEGEKGKRGSKPREAEGARVYYAVLDAPPAAPEELIVSLFATRCPKMINFREGDRGRWAYFALRWENPSGGPGPWSGIQGEMIP